MRRLVAIARRPVVWLLIVFLAAAWHFRSVAYPSPQFTVRTGAEYHSARMSNLSNTWSSLWDVSDDGSRITIAVHHSEGISFHAPVDTHLELWNARTGVNETPHLWKGEELQELLSNPHRTNNGLFDLFTQPTGMEFLTDETAWAHLRVILSLHPPLIGSACGNVQHPPDSYPKTIFPRDFSISPDGRLYSYVLRTASPLPSFLDSLNQGTVIEGVRTGRQVAYLPGVTDNVRIAPGGRTAVSVNYNTKSEGEQPRLLLWDLQTSKCRAELLLPETERYPVYSANGRYVFADYFLDDSIPSENKTRSHDLKWWDTETGRQVGEVINVAEWTIIDDGRMLVTHPTGSRDGGQGGCHILRFWNLTTGAKLGDWELVEPPNGGGRIMVLVGSERSRYLAVQYDPDYAVGRGVIQEFADDLDGNPSSHWQVLLLDIAERRVVAHLPGRSAKWSRDGRWLATIDDAGVLRVWEMPLGERPWRRPIRYAALVALGYWAAVMVVRRGFRAQKRGPVPPTSTVVKPKPT